MVFIFNSRNSVSPVIWTKYPYHSSKAIKLILDPVAIHIHTGSLHPQAKIPFHEAGVAQSRVRLVVAVHLSHVGVGNPLIVVLLGIPQGVGNPMNVSIVVVTQTPAGEGGARRILIELGEPALGVLCFSWAPPASQDQAIRYKSSGGEKS